MSLSPDIKPLSLLKKSLQLNYHDLALPSMDFSAITMALGVRFPQDKRAAGDEEREENADLYSKVDTDSLLNFGQFIGRKLGHQLHQPFFVDGPDLIRFCF